MLVSLEFDHHPHTRFIGFVPYVGNAFKTLVIDKFGDLLKQNPLIDLIGQFIDDDRLPLSFINILKMGPCTHDNPAATGSIAFSNPREPINNTCSREIGRWHELH